MGIIKERKPTLDNQMAILGQMAKDLGFKVKFDEDKNDYFIPNTVVITSEVSLHAAYDLAHQIGRNIDFKEGNLNFDLWEADKAYAICAEMSSWNHAQDLLKKVHVPLINWTTHVQNQMNAYYE